MKKLSEFEKRRRRWNRLCNMVPSWRGTHEIEEDGFCPAKAKETDGDREDPDCYFKTPESMIDEAEWYLWEIYQQELDEVNWQYPVDKKKRAAVYRGGKAVQRFLDWIDPERRELKKLREERAAYYRGFKDVRP
ncbi:MAG: hypothetical protein SPL30_05885 [Succinivibrio sp.]|nr:hypothetical protein [Succinivibrio sp.]